MDKITSTLCSINDIIDKKYIFNIPLYQRLYVWETAQVNTLFNDLHSAAFLAKDMYYLGGVIIVRNKTNPDIYDLVDGQQRFTTLWLLAYELGDSLKGFCKIGDQLRLKFAIRDFVSNYLNNPVVSPKKAHTEDDDDNDDSHDLQRIDFARRALKKLIAANLPDSAAKKRFADFVLEKLKVVVTLVPQEMDLNKLFETLNNRGEQLSQDEILKARLLEYIKMPSQRKHYACSWNAISDTANYLERALAEEAGIGKAKEVARSMDKDTLDYNQNIKTLFAEKTSLTTEKSNLFDILNPTKKVGAADNLLGEEATKNSEIDLHDDVQDDEMQPVRSILNFAQLLLHTLRIYRHQKGEKDISRINEKELLAIFDEYFFKWLKAQPEHTFGIHCKAFLDLLFEVRAVFDKYIVKWVEKSTHEEELLIKEISKQNRVKGSPTYYIRRLETEKYNGLAQLQRLLYHSQQNTTQYWLTPYLCWLQKYKPTFEAAYMLLQKLDNVLFCTNREDVLLTNRTWECMSHIPAHKINIDILEEKKGTAFPHYWFYKIDFVLWYERDKLNKEKEWGSYKFTAKNSIEHISPQKPQDPRNKVCHKFVDSMGNLVLVTRSINSEYGDKAVSVKKVLFQNKKEKGFLDSLKSDMIYRYSTWSDVTASDHQQEILKILTIYFDSIK